LPHRHGVHHIEVPMKVVTLAATPLPLVLDANAVVLTQATALKFGSQIRRSETCYAYCRRHAWCRWWARVHHWWA
jgi:hypothetical protein